LPCGNAAFKKVINEPVERVYIFKERSRFVCIEKSKEKREHEKSTTFSEQISKVPWSLLFFLTRVVYWIVIFISHHDHDWL